MMKVALLRYPGTWSERDFAHAFTLVPGVETEIVWHADAHAAEEAIRLMGNERLANPVIEDYEYDVKEAAAA